MEQFNDPGNDEDAADINVQKNFLMQVRRQIEGNDPDLVKLEIYPHYYVGRGNDWERDGKSIGENTRIKELIISGLEIYPDFDVCNGMMKQDLEKFFSGVAHNRSIKKISFCGCELPDGEIFRILAPFFKDNCSFECFHINGCGIEDEGADVLATSLTGNSTLKVLDIFGEADFTVMGWRAIFSTLQSPNCVLEKLNLACNQFKDEEMVSLANALTNNSSLKSLGLSENSEISMEGWEAFSSVLQNPNCVLEELNLSMNGINGETVNFITDALINNTTLKNLNLSNNRINDEAINHLTNALVNNTTLRELGFRNNPSVTATGWGAFSGVLQSPVSALEKLDLYSNSINEGTMISLATSLANNQKLKELILDYNPNINANGWAAFSHVVCSSSSIMDTYHSNHMLQKLWEDDDQDELPEDLRSHLRINRENCKSAAARLKILKTHFREGITVHPFVDSESKALPHAIAWMGKDGRTNEVNVHLYGFLRSMPSLFDVDHQNKRRKDTLLLDIDSKNRKRKMEVND